MIVFTPKTKSTPEAKEAEDNRFERIRKAAGEKRRKADTDSAPKTTEDKRLL